MKKHFQTYNELNEALKLSQYREYHGIRPEELENKLSSLFKGKNRIYIPFYYDTKNSEVEIPNDIKKLLGDNGYTITDYIKGYCIKDGKNQIRIGKVLNSKGSKDMLNFFNEDPQRAVKENDFLICISKHPYDIAGMSTDRVWTSCMDLNIDKNQNNKHIKEEIKEGTVIAYLISPQDKNIKKPYGRINIKSYFKGKSIVWELADYCYGLFYDKGRNIDIANKFKNSVSSWIKENLNFGAEKGAYYLSKKVYNESPLSVFVSDSEEDKKSIEYEYYRWGINIENYKGSIYSGNIKFPKDLVKFEGFKKTLGLDINNVIGDVIISNCNDLAFISNLKSSVTGTIIIENCKKLKYLSLPDFVGKDVIIWNCSSLENIKNFPYKPSRTISLKNLPNILEIKSLTPSLENLIIGNCYKLTSIVEMPHRVNGYMMLYDLPHLYSVKSIPEIIKNDIIVNNCLFFQGIVSEEDMRSKYNIKKS